MLRSIPGAPAPAEEKLAEAATALGESVHTRLGVLAALAAYTQMENAAGVDLMETRLKSPDLPAPAPEDERACELLDKLYLRDGTLTAAEIASLRETTGFFGLLAARHNFQHSDDSALDSVDREIVSSSSRFARIAAVMMSGAVFVLGCGFLLLILFLVGWHSGRIQSALSPSALPSHLFFETFTIYLLLMIGAHELGPLLGRRGIYFSIVAQALTPLVACYPLFFGAGARALRDDLGLTGGEGFLKEFGLGPLAYAGAAPLVAVGIGVTLLIVRVTGIEVSSGMHPIVPLIQNGGGWRLAPIIATAVIGAPLIEELMFRGFLYRALRSRVGAAASIVISGFFFAGIHPQGILGVPMLAAIGIALAAVREWRGSLVAPVVTHACVNGATLAFLIAIL